MRLQLPPPTPENVRAVEKKICEDYPDIVERDSTPAGSRPAEKEVVEAVRKELKKRSPRTK